MKIIISNCIEIQDPTKEMVDFVRKELTFKNPEIEKKKRMGFWTYGMDKTIKLYNEFDGKLYTPVGFFNDLYEFHPVNKDYVDYTTIKKINISSDIKLRNYQELAIPSIEKYMNGLFLIPCGLGKTELALECVNRLKQKTLWLTHTIDLVNQAKSRCESKMSCKASMITDGKMDVSGDIVFGTIQTVIMCINRGDIKQDEFGMIVGDEIHKITTNPSTLQMFRTCVEYFSARYRLGLTATLHRSDGLDKCITKIMGNVIYEIMKDRDEYVSVYEGVQLLRFPVSLFQVPATINVIETDYDIIDKDVYSHNGGTIQFTTLISDLSENIHRNNLISKVLRGLNESTIVLSDRVEQLKYLCSQVENGVQIDGSTPKKIREKALNDVRNGKVKYLFASFALAREGLDCPILSNLVMATPVKDPAIVIQSIGRIQRPYGEKSAANVYDFVDNVGMLHRFFGKRRSIYLKNGWVVNNPYLNNQKRG